MSIATRIPALVLAGLAGVGLARAEATAQEAEVSTNTRMSAAVTAAVAEQVRDLIDPQMAIGLYLVGYQRVAADTCEGFEVDPAKHQAVMNNILADVSGLVEEGQNNLPLDRVMIGYGMAVGGETAVAAYDLELYCANAAEFREGTTESGNDLFDIWQDAE